MYAIIWGEGTHELAGDVKSIISLAHLLESSKINFKVSNLSSYVDQKSFGFNGYQYWLAPESNFN